ncbi:GDSL esterase/lipase [Glycine soja]
MKLIFNFGDSIGDTRISASLYSPKVGNDAHGSTYFKHLSRCLLNERLMIVRNKREYNNYFKKSLFLVREIGGNDIDVLISYKIFQNFTLIEGGVVEILIPGNFPIGYNSNILTIMNNGIKDDYDQFECLETYNIFIKYYNTCSLKP